MESNICKVPCSQYDTKQKYPLFPWPSAGSCVRYITNNEEDIKIKNAIIARARKTGSSAGDLINYFKSRFCGTESELCLMVKRGLSRLLRCGLVYTYDNSRRRFKLTSKGRAMTLCPSISRCSIFRCLFRRKPRKKNTCPPAVCCTRSCPSSCCCVAPAAASVPVCPEYCCKNPPKKKRQTSNSKANHLLSLLTKLYYGKPTSYLIDPLCCKTVCAPSYTVSCRPPPPPPPPRCNFLKSNCSFDCPLPCKEPYAVKCSCKSKCCPCDIGSSCVLCKRINNRCRSVACCSTPKCAKRCRLPITSCRSISCCETKLPCGPIEPVKKCTFQLEPNCNSICSTPCRPSCAYPSCKAPSVESQLCSKYDDDISNKVFSNYANDRYCETSNYSGRGLKICKSDCKTPFSSQDFSLSNCPSSSFSRCCPRFSCRSMEVKKNSTIQKIDIGFRPLSLNNKTEVEESSSAVLPLRDVSNSDEVKFL